MPDVKVEYIETEGRGWGGCWGEGQRGRVAALESKIDFVMKPKICIFILFIALHQKG